MPKTATPAAQPKSPRTPALHFLRQWTTILPVLAVIALAVAWPMKHVPIWLVIPCALLMAGSVLAAVHHAEVIAHKVGEPFGSLLLAVAVTIIEVALIVTLMLSGKGGETLARDTVFAAFMITINGIAGLSMMVNAGRRGTARFRTGASTSTLAAAVALALLTMVVPNYTSATPGPTFSGVQLMFAAVVSLAIYAMYVRTLTDSHRDYFLPLDKEGNKMAPAGEHAAPPSGRATAASVVLLLVSLVAVVGLAKVLSPSIEGAVAAAGLAPGFVGVVIAVLVLLPETIAAFRHARRDRVQTAFNLAYGSAMASIGLTIPVMAVLSLVFKLPISLGLEPLQLALLAGTTAIATLTLTPGRANRLTGFVSLMVLLSFLFFSARP